MPPATVFLLSPANLSGVRAAQLTSRRAEFDAARRFRSPEGVPVSEAFSFMSALYFRGKIAYARRFAVGAAGRLEEPVLVIAPGVGLVPPCWPLDAVRFRKLARIPVDVRNSTYRRALEKDARELASRLSQGDRVVLLGSIATGKYVDVLRPLLGDHLCFPRCFVGIGDMSRGAIMLRAEKSGVELDYATLGEERHRNRGGKT